MTTSEDRTDKTYFVTTPIYYVTARPHIGTTYTTISADCVARYHRMRGRNVLFLTGSDEHAGKILQAAEEAGLDPQAFCDRMVTAYHEAWDRMHVQYDRFIRTSEEEHKQVVTAVFARLMESGDIYKDEYEGWYCIPCETYLREDELGEGGTCPDCGREVQRLAQEAYFFRTSAYSNQLLREIEANPDLILPESRRNEVLSFIRQGLRDNCISRANPGWGVEVPGDSSQVVYVWFDALINYLTAAGYLLDDEKFAATWPPDLQLMGKDILPRFHATLWPAMLMALDVEMPTTLFGHGWWVSASGDKMSKSKGNIVDPQVEAELIVEESGCTTDVAIDAVRYYMLREVPFGADGSFSSEGLLGRFNSDLANDLGNLLNRTLPLVERYLDGKLKAAGPGGGGLADKVAETVARAEECWERLDFRGMLEAVWELLAAANKFVDERAPWDLHKQGKKVELAAVLYDLVDTIRIAAILVSPVMPTVAAEIWRQIGLEDMGVPMRWDDCEAGQMPAGAQVQRGRPIFPRIDMNRLRQRIEQETAEKAAAQKAEKDAARDKGAGDMISFDEFQRLDLRVGKILDADPIEGTDKLLQLTVDLGEEEPRTIVAGIAQAFSVRELIGELIVVVANLEPATIRGVQSQGMILAAGGKEPVALIVPDRECEPGEKVR
ncbi:MAG: methionine--tRNA ligase [Armatimonadetes bacterium]|nr:methionine--tRNA ligase [Armatimonadota bacterium]